MVKEASAKPTKLFASSGVRGGSSVILPSATKPNAMSKEEKLRSIHKELDPKQLAKSRTRQARSSVSSDYHVLCPVTTEGLLIKVHSDKIGVLFNGYRRFFNGNIGPAEQKQLFGQIGDLLVAVDNRSIEGMPFKESKKILQQHNGKSQRLLSFRRRTAEMTPTTHHNPSVPSYVTVSARGPQVSVAQNADARAPTAQPSVGHALNDDCNKPAADPKQSGVSTSPRRAQSSSRPSASESNEKTVSQSHVVRASNNKSESDAKSASEGKEEKQASDSIKSAVDSDSTYDEETNESNGSISSDDDVGNAARRKAQRSGATVDRSVQNPKATQVPRGPAWGHGKAAAMAHQPLLNMGHQVVDQGHYHAAFQMPFNMALQASVYSRAAVWNAGTRQNNPMMYDFSSSAGFGPLQPAPSRHSNNIGATTASAANGAKCVAPGGGPALFVPRQEASVTYQKAAGGDISSDHDDEYDVKLTVTVEGLLLRVKDDHGACMFDGYRKFKNGENSPASWAKPFRNLGDRIVAIDGKNVEQKSFDHIVTMLTNNNNKRFRALRMREMRKRTA
jgi:hypothetical protein